MYLSSGVPTYRLLGTIQVASHIRTSCEDGKNFIRAAIVRALDDPLPPAKRPVSKSRMGKAQKLARRKAQGAGSSMPPLPPQPELPPRHFVTHFIMNLPDSAILFLGAFRGVLSPANVGERDLSGIYADMPMVHCYCFTRDPEHAEVDIREVRACVISENRSSYSCEPHIPSASRRSWDIL